MPLAANRQVERFIDQRLRSFRIKASTRVWKGAFVGVDAGGYARGLVAGDPFCGIAFEEGDNSTGGNGAKALRVETQGDFLVPLATTIDKIGDAVYASADDAATLTASTNSFIGVVIDVPNAAEIILRLDVFRPGP